MKHFYLFFALLLLSVSIAYGQNSGLRSDFLIAGFEDLALEPDTYWNGSDLSGGFTSGPVFFRNSYDEAFGSWNGWSYSNMANDSTPGFLNQYSAITAGGFDPVASGGMNYAVSYVSSDWMTGEQIPVTVDITDNSAKNVLGFYVTNSTWAALSMEFGDDFAKKFGGETGDDPDYFKLYVWGFSEGSSTDTVDFYLADYRFPDNEDDYIVKTWEWVDLSTLGMIDSLKFMMESSDTGQFGINTPTYFCIDDLTFEMESSSVNENKDKNLSINVFPNPSKGKFYLDLNKQSESVISIFDLKGRIVYHTEDYVEGMVMDISEQPAGNYIINVSSSGMFSSRMIIKQ
jgi:hypothetical protein